MGKPRIYIAIAEFHPSLGGTEQQARTQARLLRERGFKTTVVTFRLGHTWGRHDTVDGVPVIRVAGWLLVNRERWPSPLRKLSYLAAMAVMAWVLWRERRHYDVVHVYKLNVLALAAALACRTTGKPMLVVVRSAGLGDAARSETDLSWVGGPGGSAPPLAQAAEQLRLYGDLEDLARIGQPGVRFCRHLLRRNGAIVVALSSRLQAYLAAQRFDLPGGELLPNGVDTSRFTPAARTVAGDVQAQSVICVSKLRYEKGIDILLRAWRRVHHHAPQARLIIVGDGPLRAPLERMAADLGLGDSVEFVGRQTDIPSQLHRASLAVLSSRYEGMPNAVLEAMACALPCVATRVSGTEDIIQHGANGLLVEPEDADGLAQALLTLLRDPALVRAYGEAARATVDQHYALERLMDRYEALYQRLVERGRQPTARTSLAWHP